jgi:hypothetical protein
MITPYKYNTLGQVDYYCLSTDVPNLPKKADNKLGNGSSAYCIDNQNVYLYDEENDRWELQ